MEGLKEIFKEEVEKVFSNIGKCLQRMEEGSFDDKCFYCLDDIFHNLEGVLFQAGILDAGNIIAKEKESFKVLSEAKNGVEKNSLELFRSDMAEVKRMCDDFIQSEKEIAV